MPICHARHWLTMHAHSTHHFLWICPIDHCFILRREAWVRCVLCTGSDEMLSYKFWTCDSILSSLVHRKLDPSCNVIRPDEILSHSNFWTCGSILLSPMHGTPDPSCHAFKCSSHPTLKIKESLHVGAQDNACMIYHSSVYNEIDCPRVIDHAFFHSWNMNNFRDMTQFHTQFYNMLLCVYEWQTLYAFSCFYRSTTSN